MLFIAVITFKAVMTWERQEGADGCDEFRRRQCMGIRAAWRRKYLSERLDLQNDKQRGKGQGRSSSVE